MSSPFLWVLFPLVISLVSLFLRAGRSALLAALATSLVLAWAAWQIPIDSVLQLGPITFEVFPSISFFGRSLRTFRGRQLCPALLHGTCRQPDYF